MAKVTVHKDEPGDTPSQSIVKAANVATTVTDTRGRSITVKKMGPLDRLKLFEVIGADNSRNEQYVGYAALAFLVTAIDGEPVARPNSKLALEALVQRLDDDGMDAVAMHLAEQIAAREDAGDGMDALKNGSSTPS